MKRNRLRRFIQQKQYAIASLVLFAAVAVMTGIYFSNSITGRNEGADIAKEEQAPDLDTGRLPDTGEEDVKSVTSVIKPAEKSQQENKNNSDKDDTSSSTKSSEESSVDSSSSTGAGQENGVELDTDTESTGTGAKPNAAANAGTSEAQEKESSNANSSQPSSQQMQENGAKEKKDTATQAKPAKSVSLHFSPESDLAWPMQGDVIMNYSMDQTVYFSTLEQYKYNPAVIIAAKVNDPVQAAATGKITDISANEETGVTVTMDLGDGYTAKYGQLKEVLYKEGAVVESGNAIGYVAEPTKYYSVEGSNLYFELQKDGKPINPMQYMQ